MREEILQDTREAISACAMDVGKICTTLMEAVNQGQHKITTLQDLLTKEAVQRRKLFNELQVMGSSIDDHDHHVLSSEAPQRLAG